MLTFAKQAGVLSLTVVGLLMVTASSTQAQQRRFLPVHSYYPYNQNSYLFPGLPANVYNPNLNFVNRLNNPAFNRPVVYPSVVYGGGYYGNPLGGINLDLSFPGFGASKVGAYTFTTGNAGYYPAYVNPFASSYSNTYDSSNTYSPTVSSGYSAPVYPGSYGYGYYTSPYASYLYGTADVMRAYGQLGVTSEQARILREVAEQAKLETRKKLIDTMAYERAHTPSMTDIQKKAAKQEFDRLQNIATPAEVWTGKAQNVLLQDLIQKTLTKALKLHPLPLNEKLMAHVNVAGKGGYGNIGLLRNKGQFEFPVALQELATEKEQLEMKEDARQAYTRAATGLKFDTYLVTLAQNIESLRERLLKRANDMPTDQYLAAKRFLSYFEDALVAIKNGDVRRNLDFHKEFDGEGKTIQDLIDYMGRNGLRFAPAVTGDEDAYQALHSLVTAYSLAANSGYMSPHHASKDY